MACSVPTAAIYSQYHALTLTLGYTTCATKQEDTWCRMANDRRCNLLDGDAVGVMVNGANVENVLMSPFELMTATDTVYSALGIKPC